MKKEVYEGNIALCEAVLRAGCSFYAGYPITPHSSITEYLSYKMEEHGRDFVQAESEVAAINMIAGASAGGARAMTATAGPGFSLMAEGMSFIASSMFPAVIVDVQRGGAGGGNIQASQSDYNYATKTLGHGGQRAFTVGPMSVQETVDWAYKAFDISSWNWSVFVAAVVTDRIHEFGNASCHGRMAGGLVCLFLHSEGIFKKAGHRLDSDHEYAIFGMRGKGAYAW